MAIAAPWYLAMWWRHGTEYLQSFFVGDNLERFATDRFNEPRPWWYYGPVVLGGLAPWTPFVFLGLRRVRPMVSGRSGAGSLETRLLIWMAVPLLLLTVSVGKQPRYVLPLLPPLAILLAAAINDRIRARRGVDGGLYQGRPDRGVQLASLAAGLLLVAIGALLARAQPLFVDVPTWRTWAAVGVAIAGGLAVVAVSITSQWRLAPWVLAWASAATLPAVMLGALAGGEVDTVERVAHTIAQVRKGDEPIGVSRAFVRNLVFYTGLPQTDLITDEQLTAFLGRQGTALIVVPADILDQVERAGAPAATRLAEFRYFNEAGLRLRSVLAPDPERDVQRIVLVRTRG
jgi:4-amino-4-deoxy-L-arabinose transferase-like glycosyltransferase